MQLYEELLAHLLAGKEMRIAFPDLEEDIPQIIEGQCYQALQKIKALIEDESLEDRECFMKIEEIISVFESVGSSGGFRHDFG